MSTCMIYLNRQKSVMCVIETFCGWLCQVKGRQTAQLLAVETRRNSWIDLTTFILLAR